MIKGILFYKNRFILFELQGDILEISSMNFLPIKSEQEKLEKLINMFKINPDDIDKVYLIGFNYENEAILFNICPYTRSHDIHISVSKIKNKTKFKVRYYLIINSITHRKSCNLNNSDMKIKIDGKDIRKFYTCFMDNDLNNKKCELLNISSIAEYEYVYNNKTFNIVVDIMEVRKFEHNETYYKTKVDRHNILSFNIKDICLEHVLGLIHEIYYGCMNFFRYIYMKKYVDIYNNLDVECNIDDKKYDFTFVYCSNVVKIEENEKKYKNNIVKYDNIQDHVFLGKLFKLSTEQKLYLDHLPDTIGDRLKYFPSRMLEVFCLFEGKYTDNYTDNYNDNKIKSDEEGKILEEIQKFLNELSNRYENTSSKDIIKNIKTNIKNFTNMTRLTIKLSNAFEDNKDILELNDDRISKICKELNKMRNDAIHGRMSEIEFQFENFKLLEKVVYIMELKKLGLDESKIKIFLNKLFYK